MKKLSFLIFIFFLFILHENIFSQCTPIQNLPATGIYPSLKNFQFLPEAIVDSNYSTIAYFWLDSIYKVGTDTCPDGKFEIDSATIQKVFGLPIGFTFQFDKPGKTYKGGGKGCMVISGVPNDSMIGVYPLGTTIMYHLFCVAALFPVSIPKTDSVVQYLSIRKFAGISESENFQKNIIIAPNPTSQNPNLQFISEIEHAVVISIYNHTGQLIHYEKIIFNQGNNLLTLPVLKYRKGIYTIMITGKRGNYIGKVVKL